MEIIPMAWALASVSAADVLVSASALERCHTRQDPTGTPLFHPGSRRQSSRLHRLTHIRPPTRSFDLLDAETVNAFCRSGLASEIRSIHTYSCRRLDLKENGLPSG